MKYTKLTETIRLISIGSVAGAALLAAYLLIGGKTADFLLYETLPFYTAEAKESDEVAAAAAEKSGFAAEVAQTVMSPAVDVLAKNVSVDEPPLEAQPTENGVMGASDVFLHQPETDSVISEKTVDASSITPFSDGWKDDLNFLRQNFYTTAKITEMTEADFNAARFLEQTFSLSESKPTEPKIIIFHTHMYEGYSDSDPDDVMDGVFGVGELIADYLRQTYGVNVLHYAGRFDVVKGAVGMTEGAYERMEATITKILENNPSIEVAIDIHRDGVGDDVRLVADIGGASAAQIMFVNGLSKIKENGVLRPLTNLPNPFLESNLALSFRAQLTANELYPTLARKIYLNAYRYSLNMLPKSLLIEVGAQTNTKREAFNAAVPIAEILANTLGLSKP